MRFASLVLFVPALAVAEPTQLPPQCKVLPSPVDEPCTKLSGRYRIDLAPRTKKSCVVKKRISGVLVVEGESDNPPIDAKQLLQALGHRGKPRLYGGVKSGGVCCLVLTFEGLKPGGDWSTRVFMAAGASVVNAKAKDKSYDEASRDLCQEELDVTVTKLR